MLREIVIPTSENYSIHIPKEFVNNKAEILVFSLEDNDKGIYQSSMETVLSETFGILEKHPVDAVKWQREIRKEWDDRL